MHCGWLTIRGETMAKRSGQLYLVPELQEMGYDGDQDALAMHRSIEAGVREA